MFPFDFVVVSWYFVAWMVPGAWTAPLHCSDTIDHNNSYARIMIWWLALWKMMPLCDWFRSDVIDWLWFFPKHSLRVHRIHFSWNSPRPSALSSANAKLYPSLPKSATFHHNLHCITSCDIVNQNRRTSIFGIDCMNPCEMCRVCELIHHPRT